MRTVVRLLSIALLAVSVSAILAAPRSAFAGEVCLGKPVTMTGAGAIEGTVGNVDTACDMGGNDDIFGGDTGNDRLYGEAGNDTLNGDSGVLDRCSGGDGVAHTPDAGCKTTTGIP